MLIKISIKPDKKPAFESGNTPWVLDSPAMRNNYAMIATSAPQRVAVEDGTGAAYAR